jgi:hypothetical protein
LTEADSALPCSNTRASAQGEGDALPVDSDSEDEYIMSEDIVLTIAPKSNTWSSTDQNMVDAWIRSTVGAQLSVSARSSIAASDAAVIQQTAMLTAHVVFLYHGAGGATESYVTQKSKIIRPGQWFRLFNHRARSCLRTRHTV